jgi:membrane fusion protein, copper/silver efflux system
MKHTCFLIAEIAAACGWYGALHFRNRADAHPKGEASEGLKTLLYQSPMRPWVNSDRPGQCAVCGMDLVPVYEGGKNFDHAASDIVMLPKGSPNAVGVQSGVLTDNLRRIENS